MKHWLARLLRTCRRTAGARAFWLCLVLATGADHSRAVAETRVALVIGNEAYTKVGRLANAARDAAAIEAMLKSAGFGNVTRIDNLGGTELRRALRNFSDRANGADIALVYFAGHGIEINGVNYLLPVDAMLQRDIDVEDEAVSLDRVVQVLANVKRLRLVILDACRDNPFVQGMRRTIATRSIGRGLAKVEVNTSDTLIAYAAKAGSTALDGDGQNSPYAQALVKHLPTPGLDVRLALGRVRDEVVRTTTSRQEPFVYGSLGGSEIPLVGAAPAGPSTAELERARQLAEAERARAAADLAAREADLRRREDEARRAEEARRKLATATPQADAPSVRAPPPPPQQPKLDGADISHLTRPLLAKDKGRLARIAESREKALQRSLRNAGDNAKAKSAIAAVQGLLAMPAVAIDEKLLIGRWHCRSYSIGGTLGDGNPEFAAQAAGQFSCRIARDANGLVFQKLTGSMKKLARLVPLPNDRVLYYGTTIAQSDKQPVYPEGDQYGHEVGLLAQLGPDRLLLELSEPNHYASAGHEVVELVRMK